MLERLIELLAGDAWLHGHRQVLGVQSQDAIHARHVQADAAPDRQQVPLQRGACTVGDDRHPGRSTKPDHPGHFSLALGKHHGLRRRHVEHRLIAPMLLSHREGGGATGAEIGLQFVQKALRQRHRNGFESGWRVHWQVS